MIKLISNDFRTTRNKYNTKEVHLNTQDNTQINELLKHLNTDAQLGLSEEIARQRLEEFGPNEIKETSRQSAIVMFLSQFKGVMTLLLIVAGIISAITGDIKDTIIISMVVILNAVMGFVQEYRAEKSILALKKMAEPTTKVIRNGKMVNIPTHEIVPGDITRLQAGDLVPADGRLVETANLTIEEAVLTGESVPSEKDALFPYDPNSPIGDRKGNVFMGTTVVQGRGLVVIEKTGMNTELGNIAALIGKTPDNQTPLQKRLSQLGVYLAIGAVFICIIVFIAGILQGQNLKIMLLAAITLAVAAVPESLPTVITISLALGAQRMVKRHALIRKLPAVETLGCVTAICTDKTGTLTQNQMQVESLYVGGNQFKRTENGYEIENDNISNKTDTDVNAMLEAMTLSNDTEIQRTNDDLKTIGDPTETSLVQAAIHFGIDVEKTKQGLKRVSEIPFDSVRKRMTTINQNQSGIFSFTKGALDVILPRCTHEMKNGEIQDLSEERIAEILKTGEQIAARGSRIMAAASKTLSEVPTHPDQETIENNLVFLGFAAISDPPRPEAAEAVKKCKEAGIQVIMITGDHKLTAAAIGSDLGIVNNDNAVCIGSDLEKLTNKSLADNVANCNVFARVSPEHKVRIVTALQENGHIVAMTGDGVNDAPSLKRADVGVAMGITGTDVSREASDIILTDDNFATIVAAVEEGRIIYDNIRKFVRYTLATNMGEVMTMFIGMLAGLPLPLLPIQILWINLVTDGLPALALSVEPAEGDVMKRPPRAPDESIFARGLWQHILWVGSLMAIATVILFAIKLQSETVVYARTMAFFTIAAFQLFHVMAIRREREAAFKTNINTNRSLTLAVFATSIMQVLLIYIEPIAKIFKLVPISFADIMLCTLISSSVFFAVETEKAFYRRRTANIK